jgi:hypothetical protein
MKRQRALPDRGATAASPAPLEHAPEGPFSLLSKLLPETTMSLAAVALALRPDLVGPQVRESLYFVAFAEVMFCLGQGTLTDISTRLRKRPPWWLLLGIVLLLGVMYPEVFTLLVATFQQGWPVFVPFLWSVLERLRELWTMPGAPVLEKLRRRALVSDRIALVLVFGGTAVAVAAVSYAIDDERGGFALVERQVAWWLAVAFATAAYDIWRVHRPAFARQPRALFGRFDPLGVDYLAPL